MPFSRDNPFTGETFLGEFPGGYTDNSGIAIETRNIKNSILSKQFKSIGITGSNYRDKLNK